MNARCGGPSVCWTGLAIAPARSGYSMNSLGAFERSSTPSRLEKRWSLRTACAPGSEDGTAQRLRPTHRPPRVAHDIVGRRHDVLIAIRRVHPPAQIVAGRERKDRKST